MLWSGGLTHVNRGCTFLNAFKSVVYRVALKLCPRNILLPEPTQYGLGIEFSNYTGEKLVQVVLHFVVILLIWPSRPRYPITPLTSSMSPLGLEAGISGVHNEYLNHSAMLNLLNLEHEYWIGTYLFRRNKIQSNFHRIIFFSFYALVDHKQNDMN